MNLPPIVMMSDSVFLFNQLGNFFSHSKQPIKRFSLIIISICLH